MVVIQLDVSNETGDTLEKIPPVLGTKPVVSEKTLCRLETFFVYSRSEIPPVSSISITKSSAMIAKIKAISSLLEPARSPIALILVIITKRLAIEETDGVSGLHREGMSPIYIGVSQRQGVSQRDVSCLLEDHSGTTLGPPLRPLWNLWGHCSDLWGKPLEAPRFDLFSSLPNLLNSPTLTSTHIFGS